MVLIKNCLFILIKKSFKNDYHILQKINYSTTVRYNVWNNNL